jgi:putative phosphoribosyl transferase
LEAAQVRLPELAAPRGLVLLPGGGARDRLMAAILERRLATLLVDEVRQLVAVTLWAAAHPTTRHLRIGYCASAASAQAALEAAAELPDVVAAVVCRGARPEGSVLPRVHAPTLLVVGSDDREGLAANQAALGQLAGLRELAVLAGASARFSEPGALGRVAELAGDWLVRWLGPAGLYAG